MFHTLESPIHSVTFAPHSLSHEPVINNNFFNVTMTYSSRSAVHVPYGRLVQVRDDICLLFTAFSFKITDHPVGEELEQFITNYGEQNTS